MVAPNQYNLNVLRERLRALREAEQRQTEMPQSGGSKVSKQNIKPRLNYSQFQSAPFGYGKQISKYRADRIAERTLVVREMDVLDRARIAVDRDPNAKTPKYQRNNPLIQKGRVVE